MKYDFSNMKGKNNTLYTKRWGGTEFSSVDFITNKNWTGNESKDSFFIKTPETTKVFDQIIPALAKDLADAFELKNKERFTEKLRQACGGSGQEAMKIATMHSSSLCSLLFFYNVSEKSEGNELVLSLGNGIPKETYVFKQSFFEFQNVVIKGRQPSNMDVVLIGHEKDNPSQSVILLLESKFSEYYMSLNRYIDISNAYQSNVYGDTIYKLLEKTGKYIITNPPDIGDKFRLNVSTIVQNGKNASKPEYIHGIKQMISHYIGVRNLLDEAEQYNEDTYDGTCAMRKKVVGEISKHAKVFLGSIIFDDLFRDGANKFYDDYKENYKVIAEILNNVSSEVDKENGIKKVGNLTVIEEPLTYTKLVEEMKKQNFQLDKKVEEYYFEKAKATTSDTSEC